MKRNLLLFAATILSISVFGQNTVNIFANGAAGSYTTGSSTNAVRTDNTIVSTGSMIAPTRGYAVFDLNAVPAGATITAVELHYNMAAVAPGGGPGWNTRGYVGDLSTITTAGTLYTTMGLASTIWNTPYPTTAGNAMLGTNGAAVTFVQSNIGGKVSIIWSTNSTRTYTITGETGATTTTGTHAPYLTVTYDCPGITSVAAVAPATDPCPNTDFNLTANAVGTIISYAWAGPGGFSSATANPTVVGGIPANGTYTLTVTDNVGCSASATVVVTVSPAPAADILPLTVTAFCDADSATLSAVTSSGVSYQWYDGSTAIPGATDQNYVSYITGNYRVEVTDLLTGCTAITTAPTPTVRLATPEVTPGDSILLCAGDNGTISVNTNGITSGISFQWQRDGMNISPGGIGATYVASVTGTYRCVLSVPASIIGCTTTSEEVFVLVNDYPSPAVAYASGVLSTASIYAHYQWFLNTVLISGATSPSYTPTTPGSYRVRVTDANGCTAFSTGYSVFSATAVSDIKSTEIKLYPNPTNTILNIGANEPMDVIISTISGRTVLSQQKTSAIDMTSLPAGLYIATIYNQNGERVAIEKITKQ